MLEKVRGLLIPSVLRSEAEKLMKSSASSSVVMVARQERVPLRRKQN